MSQETPIGNLGGGISDEDSKLVDSILNDINSSSGPPQMQQQGQGQQGGGQGQQPSPEQIKMMQHQQMMRQQAAQQQAQQQAMAQQQAQQQAMTQQKMNMIQGSGSGDIMENVKLEAKNIMTVVFLCIIFNIEQVDNILKGVSMFVNEGGGLNMQAVFLKSILIGLIFYTVKTYLL
tara:strand:+ start:384 stop:911 length:528 start_codon:yes stop_codon:yes gene_type:complete